MGEGESRGNPKLAIIHEPESVSLLQLVGEYSNWLDLVWAVDTARLSASDFRQLSRFGTVCDIGSGERKSVAALAALGVDAVLTFADGQLIRTAEIAGELGLPGNSVTTARRLVDKLAQRRALASAGIPGPRFSEVNVAATSAETSAALESVTYPAVLKPAVGWGGRNTFAVMARTDALELLAAHRAAGDYRTMIIEELLGAYPPETRDGLGDYVSVESVVCRGEVTTIQVIGRMPLAADFRETGAFAPAGLSDEVVAELSRTVVDAARALEVEFGCLHTEIKLTAEGPRIIEVNGRVGGGGVPRIVSDTTGVSLHQCAAWSALGRPAPRNSWTTRPGVSYALALQPPLRTPTTLRRGWRDVLHGIAGVHHIEARADRALVQAKDGSYGYLVMLSGTTENLASLLDVYRSLYSVMETAT